MTAGVIQLFPRESECRACGAYLVNPGYAIPIYEDLVLPNDWAGKWAGSDACRRCYEAQQALRDPTQIREFAKAQRSAT